MYLRMVLRAAFRPLLLPAWLATAAWPAAAITLYETDFEDFPAGADKWAGTNGWVGTSTGVGCHGIDQDMVPGLGRTAFLGYKRPRSTFVTVFRAVPFDPVSNAMPVVELESLMGIQDSTNGQRDSFFFTIYNGAGSLLGSIRFDNSELSYGIWRLDGTNQFDTGVDFVRSELHVLLASINFTSNRWTAYLDGIPLFTNAQFNGTGRTLNLGYTAAEWQLSASSTNQYGDNWMLVADWAVRAYPSMAAAYAVQAAAVSAAGSPTVTWAGSRGFDYAVEHSPDLASWTNGLQESVFTNVQTNVVLTFTDADANAAQRFYRIRRSYSP